MTNPFFFKLSLKHILSAIILSRRLWNDKIYIYIYEFIMLDCCLKSEVHNMISL